MTTLQVTDYERVWVEGLNRGDVSAADEAFAPDCVVHITGIADPIRGVEGWKQVVSGLLAAILDRIVDGRVVERWEQWDQSLMLQQLGLQ